MQSDQYKIRKSLSFGPNFMIIARLHYQPVGYGDEDAISLTVVVRRKTGAASAPDAIERGQHSVHVLTGHSTESAIDKQPTLEHIRAYNEALYSMIGMADWVQARVEKWAIAEEENDLDALKKVILMLLKGNVPESGFALPAQVTRPPSVTIVAVRPDLFVFQGKCYASVGYASTRATEQFPKAQVVVKQAAEEEAQYWTYVDQFEPWVALNLLEGKK
jgi:hypothetical protein